MKDSLDDRGCCRSHLRARWAQPNFIIIILLENITEMQNINYSKAKTEVDWFSIFFEIDLSLNGSPLIKQMGFIRNFRLTLSFKFIPFTQLKCSHLRKDQLVPGPQKPHTFQDLMLLLLRI